MDDTRGESDTEGVGGIDCIFFGSRLSGLKKVSIEEPLVTAGAAAPTESATGVHKLSASPGRSEFNLGPRSPLDPVKYDEKLETR